MAVLARLGSEELADIQNRICAKAMADRGPLPGNPLRARSESLRLRLSYDRAVIAGNKKEQAELAFMLGLG